MKGERTRAACMADAMDTPFPRVPLPVDISDEEQFPEFAEARRFLESLPPERRAQLEAEWNA